MGVAERPIRSASIETSMTRRDFDPHLSPFLGELIERRRKSVDVLSRQGLDQDPEAGAPMMVQLAVLQGCISAVSEVIAEAKATAKLDLPKAGKKKPRRAP